MAHHIVHWEIMGPDGPKLAAFYRELFDWELRPTPGFDDYHLVSPEESGVGGAIGSSESLPNYVAVYVEVDDIDAHLQRVEQVGGRTLVPRTVIPGTVTFALFTDPAGNTIGLVEPGTPPEEG